MTHGNFGTIFSNFTCCNTKEYNGKTHKQLKVCTGFMEPVFLGINVIMKCWNLVFLGIKVLSEVLEPGFPRNKSVV
jgi:hypothetical protein